MNGGIALLDTNVPMYAAGQAHPYKEPCAWVMAEIVEGRLKAAMDTEHVQEILYRFSALQKWETAVSIASTLMEIVPTLFPVLPADARLAVELFGRYAAQGVKARDLLHVAVMRNNGITQIISADRHFDRVEGIIRLDPQDLYRQARG